MPGNAKYTLNIFLKKSKIKHGEKYDYSQAKEENIKNKNSKILIICKKCGHEWNSTINNHINNGSGCLQSLNWFDII